MADMEIHEHIVLEGAASAKTAYLEHPLMHHNVETLSRISASMTSTELGSQSLVAGRRQCAGSDPIVLWFAGPAAAVVAEEVLCASGIASILLSLQIHLLSGISRRHPRADLLWVAGRAILPHQSKDL